MRTFVIIAERRETIRGMEFEVTARVMVEAKSLSDAYKLIRTVPAYKQAYLRPE